MQEYFVSLASGTGNVFRVVQAYFIAISYA